MHRERTDEIVIEHLEVPCIVGLYPREHATPQPVIVTLKVGIPLFHASATLGLRSTIDYAMLAGEVRFILQHGGFRLIETACEAILRHVLAPPTPDMGRVAARHATIELRKPEALPGATVASVRMSRRVEDFHFEVMKHPVGDLMVIHESADASLFRLLLPGYSGTASFVHASGVCYEMPLSQGIAVGSERTVAGVALPWSAGQARQYLNLTPQPRALCCLAKTGGVALTDYLVESCGTWDNPDRMPGQQYFSPWTDETPLS